jgi:hypothetical protein
MSKLCAVCLVNHPLNEYGYLKNNELAPYCVKMSLLKPYQRYRIRKRNEDEEAFLNHNATLMKNYRVVHPEIDERYNRERRMVPEKKMSNCIVNHARAKGITFIEEDRDIMTEKLSMPCFYCNYLQIEVELNGLDRIDSSGPYSDDNTVPSCDTCNFMKMKLSPHQFLTHVSNIINNRNLQSIHIPPPKAQSFFGKTKSTVPNVPKRTKADKRMLLTVEEQTQFAQQPCSYCGQNGKVGFDRINSELPYVVQNVVSCCTTCNYMKKDLSPSDFLNQCIRIYLHKCKKII